MTQFSSGTKFGSQVGSPEEMRDPTNWVYIFLRETMEHQGIKDPDQILRGLRQGIDWLLEEI